MNLSRVLLYSARTLQKIRQIISRSRAFIVCGLADKIDVQLAYHLDLPLFMGNP